MLKLGSAPTDPGVVADQTRLLAVVVAYRDRYGITTAGDALGPIPDRDAQRIDYERARAAAAGLRDQTATATSPAPPPSREATGRSL